MVGATPSIRTGRTLSFMALKEMYSMAAGSFCTVIRTTAVLAFCSALKMVGKGIFVRFI